MMSRKPFKQKYGLSPSAAGALYVHVPFCLAKCRYCDFYSIPCDGELDAEYVRAAGLELAANASCLRTPLESAFVGGGTPTALGANLLEQLLSLIQPLLGADTEFSVEANPGTLDDSIVDVLTRSGVNRVNLGVQSFQDAELAGVGRIHNSRQALAAIDLLRKAGFDNLGLDLIYGLPGQTLESWESSLRQGLELGIEHLSCYALSFESGTPLRDDLQAGRVKAMDELLQRDCYDAAISLATQAGMEHYEISNFSMPAYQCRHNLTYWHNLSYLGIGPAAASYIDGVRRTNKPDLRMYLDSLRQGQSPPLDSEKLTGRALMSETIMLGLRMIAGIDREEFSDRFGFDPAKAFPKSFGRYISQGALIETAESIRLSRQALFVADTILADILAE